MALPGVQGVSFEVNSLAERPILNQQRKNFSRKLSGAVGDHQWGKARSLMGRKKQETS